jgi:hypothetical protein
VQYETALRNALHELEMLKDSSERAFDGKQVAEAKLKDVSAQLQREKAEHAATKVPTAILPPPHPFAFERMTRSGDRM